MTGPLSPFERVDQARAALTDTARGEAVERQHGRGRLTARERIGLLVGGGGFIELGGLAGPAVAQDGRRLEAPADGVVTGIANVDGRRVVVASFDFTVLGGSNGAVGMAKVEHCARRALHDRIPLVLLCDGGGHRMQEGLDSRHAAPGSPLFRQLVDLSGFVPTVTVMMGPGFGVSTNLAAISDFVVMVKGISTLGMSSAPFVRAATGEQMTNEQIGGAEVQAARGVAHLAVDDEKEALHAVRAYLSYLPSSALDEPLRGAAPWLPTDVGIDSVVPVDPRQAYDVRDVIDGLCDDESVFELQRTCAPNIVTTFARIEGRPLAVVANQPLHLAGSLDSSACEKAAHFIAVADAFGLPVLMLIDVPGFQIGSAAEDSQLARRSGRLIHELAGISVPRFSIVTRKGYGAAYIAMGGGRSADADLSLAWPTAEICAMPIEGAVDIGYRREIEAADDPAAHRAALVERFRTNIDPLLAAESFGIDAVVRPSETRDLLAEALGRVRRREPRVQGKRRSISPI
ncbi:MAG: carboxyl transferase domain-containing protein [Bacillota bacterium]|nr:carboxyl transferase domain-containing protein [Bacillota bacterium]